MTKKVEIHGLRSCGCHPFKDKKELSFYNNQKFNIGDSVRQRCKSYGNYGKGSIAKIYDLGYYLVIFENGHPTGEQEHCSNLISEKAGD